VLLIGYDVFRNGIVVTNLATCRVRELRQPDKCSDGDTSDERFPDWNEATQSATQKTERVKSTDSLVIALHLSKSVDFWTCEFYNESHKCRML